MNICHVSAGLCPRMVKLAWCQQEFGDTVSWIGERHTYQRTLPFKQMEIGTSVRHGGIVGALKKQKCDLFHVHTHIMDTRILDTVRKTVDKPIVWDCHDAPMEGMTEKADLGPNDTLGRVTYRPYCPRAWFPPAKAPTFNGIVIATGLSDAPGHFRYWLDVFRELDEMDVPVRCYTFSEVPVDYLAHSEVRKPVDVRRLIREMSDAVAGLCGSPHPDANMKAAQPNKLWEYVAAGIPAICLGREHDMAQEIEAAGIGSVAESVGEIVDLFHEMKETSVREDVVVARYGYTMESQLSKIIEVYEAKL